VYSITEAGFRMLDPIWIFLLLSVVGSSGVAVGLFGGKARTKVALRADKGRRTLGNNEPEPNWGATRAVRGGLTSFEAARGDGPR